MIAFYRLPAAVQDFVCFWALLACLLGLTNVILLWRQRRYRFCALPAVCFLIAYFILHVCRAGEEERLFRRVTFAASAFLQWPCAIFPVMLLLLSAAGVLLFRSVRIWRKMHITSASIKESIDGLPAGVCCYLDEGRCVLVNHRMNDIAFALFGRTLQNGAAFYAYVKDRPVHALPDGTAVSFRHRVLTNEGAPLHELIADDITELYEKSERLRRDNLRARQLAAGMKAYGETIDDTVRRQETLQAKINIHDEMNRMILATQRAALDGGSESERAAVLRMWQGQALLLCREADTRKSHDIISDLNALADVIGLRAEWNGAPETEDDAVLTLFLAAAREAMTNAAKHADAETLVIDVTETGDALAASFRNDGRKPHTAVREAGGLTELRRRIEKAGGQMQVTAQPEFCLAVTIPKGGKDHAVQSPDRGGPGDAPAAL